MLTGLTYCYQNIIWFMIFVRTKFDKGIESAKGKILGNWTNKVCGIQNMILTAFRILDETWKTAFSWSWCK